MPSRRIFVLSSPCFLLAFCWFLAEPAQTAILSKLSPQRKIEPFTLNDPNGAKHSLSDWSEKQAIVVAFLGTECPLAKLYGGRLAKLQTDYADRGVQVVGINANRQDTLREMARYANKHGVNFPLLKDAGGKVAQQFGATRTPEVFLLDADRRIRYQGRIDDQYGVGYSRGEARESELLNALDALLDGKPIEVAKTQAVGCLIAMPQKSPTTGEVTYSKQISRLMQKHCVSCHREGQIAPFALTNYDDTSAWAGTMLEVIENRRMPPWHASPEHGKFLNDARMMKEERELFRRWVEEGTPEGDAAELPEPQEFVEGWQIPKPDVVLKMPDEFKVRANGVVPYHYAYVDPGFTEDVWVRAAEARPGNREVVHHIILFYIPPKQDRHRAEDALFNMVVGFAPGTPPINGLTDRAIRIPAGSKLVFQVHYTPNGTATTDRSEVGLVFADADEVRQEIHVEAGLNFRFRIPPGDSNHLVKANYRIKQDSLLFTLNPHMHYRGKSFRFTAEYPDGKEEILLDVPHYDFNWQNTYVLKDPKFMPQGTKVAMRARFDNSENNPLNPDPSASVHWGDQTWDEMMLGSLSLSHADENRLAAGPIIKRRDDGSYDVTFRYEPAAKVEKVALAGDFNEWQKAGVPMKGPNKQGHYTLTRTFTPGKHAYKFVVNGTDWKTDAGNPKSQGYYKNSVLELE